MSFDTKISILLVAIIYIIIYINYLEFFCKAYLSVLLHFFICLIVDFYQYGLQYYSVSQIVPALAVESAFSLLLCPFYNPLHFQSTALLLGTTGCSRLIL